MALRRGMRAATSSVLVWGAAGLTRAPLIGMRPSACHEATVWRSRAMGCAPASPTACGGSASSNQGAMAIPASTSASDASGFAAARNVGRGGMMGRHEPVAAVLPFSLRALVGYRTPFPFTNFPPFLKYLNIFTYPESSPVPEDPTPLTPNPKPPIPSPKPRILHLETLTLNLRP